MDKKSLGMAIKNLSTKQIIETIIRLPPLPEQKRIVAKIDQLMALCDSLEQGIDAATQKQSAVLWAVLAQV
jgi:type I restriction enzyme S subunit